MTEPVGPNPFADDPLVTRHLPPGGPSGANPFADDPLVVKRVAPAPPERTWGDTLRSAGQTADDAVRAAANTLTFGMADRLAGLTGEGGTDAQVRLSQEARKRSPVASVVGDVGGAVALPGLGGARVASALGSGIKARMAGYGLEGAVLGGLSGAGNTYTGKPQDYIDNALMGSVFGLGAGALGGAAFGPRPPVSGAVRPNSAATGRTADYAYDAVRANPTNYNPATFQALAPQLEQRLALYNPQFSQAAVHVANQIRNAQAVTPASIDVLRQQLNSRGSSGLVRRALDDFMVNPPPGAVAPAQQAAAREASQIVDTARQLYSGAARTRTMENMAASARNATGRTGNLAERQAAKVQSFIDPATKGAKDRLRGFNAEERELLQGVVTPPALERNLGRVGDALSGKGTPGGPLAAMAVLGGASGAAGYFGKDNPYYGLLGAGLPLAGLAMRGGANRMSANAFNRAAEKIAERNPLYAHRVANAPMVPGWGSAPATQSLRDMIAVGLLGRGSGDEPPNENPLRITVTPR